MEFEDSFFEACMNGNSNKVIHFIEDQHFDYNSRDEDQRTGLHWAASSMNSDLVSYLLELPGIEIDALDDIHWTPLFCAISSGRYDNAVLLIEAKADVNHIDLYHKSLLHLIKGHTNLCKLLCQHMKNVDLHDEYGVTPLMRACTYGDLDSVKLLIEYGADIHNIDDQKNTPLHYACMDQQKSIFDYLVSKGANREARNNEGLTPEEML